MRRSKGLAYLLFKQGLTARPLCGGCAVPPQDGGDKIKLLYNTQVPIYEEANVVMGYQGPLFGLEAVQIRTLGLVALGWGNEQIGKGDWVGAAAVAARLRTIKNILGMRSASRLRLAFWYVDNLLPFDTHSGFDEPGEKLYVWRIWATLQLQSLVHGGRLGADDLALIRLMGDQQYANSHLGTLAEVLSLQTDEPVSYNELKNRLTCIYKMMWGGGGQILLSVFAYLSQLDVPDGYLSPGSLVRKAPPF
jgi:hypothetical protein